MFLLIKVLLPTGWKRKWFQAEDRHHYLSPMMEVSSLSQNESICALIELDIFIINYQHEVGLLDDHTFFKFIVFLTSSLLRW